MQFNKLEVNEDDKKKTPTLYSICWSSFLNINDQITQLLTSIKWQNHKPLYLSLKYYPFVWPKMKSKCKRKEENKKKEYDSIRVIKKMKKKNAIDILLFRCPLFSHSFIFHSSCLPKYIRFRYFHNWCLCRVLPGT